MGKYLIIFLFFIASYSTLGCSQKPCKEVSTEGLPKSFTDKLSKTLFVYKYDGTKQCGQGAEISLEAMSKELRSVRIISMSKRNDGMMRIQVCGSPTGNANVYEILTTDLNKAKKSGFQEWKF